MPANDGNILSIRVSLDFAEVSNRRRLGGHAGLDAGLRARVARAAGAIRRLLSLWESTRTPVWPTLTLKRSAVNSQAQTGSQSITNFH